MIKILLFIYFYINIFDLKFKLYLFIYYIINYKALIYFYNKKILLFQNI